MHFVIDFERESKRIGGERQKTEDGIQKENYKNEKQDKNE